MQTFSDFKSNFYSRITDFSVFDCGDLNVFKIVLEGLKVNYTKKMKYRAMIFAPNWYALIYRAISKFRHRSLINVAKLKLSKADLNPNIKNLIIDQGREGRDKNGKTISFYFQKIADALGQKETRVLYQSNTFSSGINIERCEFINKYSALSKQDIDLKDQLKKTYLKIKDKIAFDSNEIKNIEIALDRFFNAYRFWNVILKDSKIKNCFFMPHYHNEGLIYALKKNKVKAIEIQHGLIAPEDIFYVFPKSITAVASRSLFPDKIFTFGKYWKQVLESGAEFLPDQIEILGDYIENNTILTADKQALIDHFSNSSGFILITTQTFLHEEFIKYTVWLSADLVKKNSPVKIIVKLHPSEKIKDYTQLFQLKNVLVLENINLNYLLLHCSFHVSIYSTTLFDALKYKCKNYSLNSPKCKDYVVGMLMSGVSTLLEFDQNPIDVPTSQMALEKIEFFFDDFEKHKHKLLEC
jgi:hypothetical protein